MRARSQLLACGRVEEYFLTSLRKESIAERLDVTLSVELDISRWPMLVHGDAHVGDMPSHVGHRVSEPLVDVPSQRCCVLMEELVELGLVQQDQPVL